MGARKVAFFATRAAVRDTRYVLYVLYHWVRGKVEGEDRSALSLLPFSFPSFLLRPLTKLGPTSRYKSSPLKREFGVLNSVGPPATSSPYSQLQRVSCAV